MQLQSIFAFELAVRFRGSTRKEPKVVSKRGSKLDSLGNATIDEFRFDHIERREGPEFANLLYKPDRAGSTSTRFQVDHSLGNRRAGSLHRKKWLPS